MKVDDKLLIPIQLSKEDDERYRSLKQFEQVKKKSLKNSYKSDFIEVDGQVDVIFGKPSSKTYEVEKMRNIGSEEGYTPAKLISADYGVDVIFGNEKLEVNEATTILKEGKEENKKTTDGGSTKQEYPMSFEYRMFVRVMQKYNLKVWNDLFYIYSDMSGAYEPVREKILKAMIRNGWDEKTVSKLTRNVMADIIERISTEPSIQVDDEYFNSNRNLMNFWNGVLDLETGYFIKHSPEFKFTYCVQADYEENPSGGKMFRKFLKTSLENNAEKEIHLQEIIGYMLSEYYSAKKVPMIIGQKHSGKSTLSRIITVLIGKQHVSHVPLHRLHERFILAHLSTKKANICSEISDEPMGNVEILKALSGEDELVAEFKGKDHFTYRSRIKLMFFGNNDPVLKNRDVTSAFYDRFTFISFNKTIPAQERDRTLEEKILENDRSYIVAWAIEGLKRLVANNFAFSESEESLEHKKRYIMDQNNTIDFIKSRCVFGEENKVHLKSLYYAYTRYCNENCFKCYSKEEFFTEVSKYKVTKRKFRLGGSKALWGYVGIGLKAVTE
jgi:putative DNA primase/helicase